MCTHALAAYLGRPVSRALTEEIERITAGEIYDRQVFFVRNLGFCEPTSARRISFEESLIFEKIHEQSYPMTARAALCTGRGNWIRISRSATHGLFMASWVVRNQALVSSQSSGRL